MRGSRCIFRPLRIAGAVVTIVAALGFYGHHVRAQSTAANVIPLRPLAPLSTVPVPDVPGLSNYVANKTAAIALGKTLFWDMQAGSDGVQACASCHFNAGADSRVINEVSPGIKAGDITFQMGVPLNGKVYPNYKLKPGTATAGFGGYHDGDFPLHKQGNVDTRNSPGADVNDVVGSQGVFSNSFDQVKIRSSVEQQTIVSDQIFSFPDPANSANTINTRRVEPRNTPSVVDAVFNHRNFWDGRAQNTCNGANPFGERDSSSHFYTASATNATMATTLVRLQNSALCSQSLGPPGSNFEMSAANRTFRDIGKKLLHLRPLDTTTKNPLAQQTVDPTDSVLGSDSAGAAGGLQKSYVDMVEAAFQPQWWQQSNNQICIASDGVTETIMTSSKDCPAGTTGYYQIEYNFSLFWGIALQLYESTLIANQTPLDQYLAQQQAYTLTGDNAKNFYTIQLPANVDPYTISVIELNPNLDASDEDVFAFDDGHGQVTGPGITSGTIDYLGGTLAMQFDLPPKAAFPIKISYSIGATPLTQAQLHGLQVFQTNGRCVACHGGPELSNASVANVTAVPLERMVMGDLNVRVYDDGFYNIAVRPGADDISLGDVDGAAGLPLSQAEYYRQKACADPTFSMMIPGRPGEGLTSAPLSCSDTIARTGFFKVPQLRNVALTAPYFHNGGQLTLEQVVEFYNRGGDFPDGAAQLPLVDPNIVPLGLTMQEKTDLVDFLRNGLTDPRTVAQSAPFDHPSIYVPNGHPADPNGYPVQNDPNHPGQATDQMLSLPATGRTGGHPLPSFLDNLLGRTP